ncbi:MAG: hypothetical protein HC922_06765 [Leptolyngbyaceae cyanobacterium SM2_3_12]|nr:hypothetical protein [Leptolyngbyaceae cyanobacterium SM2_3_12]
MTYSITPKSAAPKSAAPKSSISNRKLYPVLAAGLILALVAGAGLKMVFGHRSSSNSESAPSATAIAESASGTSPEIFKSAPFFQPSAPIRLANPALLQSTSAPVRVQAVAAGRPDPFASIVIPSPGSARPAPATVTPVPAVSPAQPLPAVPIVATQALPALPPVLPALPSPAVPGSAVQNPIPVAVAPTNSPIFQSLLDQIVVSGVVQIGNDVSLIVTEPGNASSRRVSSGDLVAGGRVRIKSVDLSSSEPVVVLTYDGKDYTRIVGNNAMIGDL